MALVIGIDEAGYGPNLGPLVIGGSLWRVPDADVPLYELLHGAVCHPDHVAAEPNDGRLVIGDSKRLYRAGHNLGSLELPVTAMLHATGVACQRADELLTQITELEMPELAGQPGYDWKPIELPIAVDAALIQSRSLQLRAELEKRDIECCRLAATVIFPGPWNRQLEELGNKSRLLSAASCRLAGRLMTWGVDRFPEERGGVRVFCDKHGGRNRYAAILQHELSESFVRVICESREESSYRWSAGESREVRAHFLARGESELPVAVASMLAKYLRELSMMAWNRFWKTQVPGLRPTAGYPQDARRFRRDIARAQSQLAIDTRSIWRAV